MGPRFLLVEFELQDRLNHFVRVVQEQILENDEGREVKGKEKRHALHLDMGKDSHLRNGNVHSDALQ